MKIRQFKISTKRVQANYISGKLTAIQFMVFLVLFFGSLLTSHLSFSQVERSLEDKAQLAYAQQEYKQLLVFTEEMYRQWPDKADVLRMHAAALARNGKTRNSLEVLRAWVYKDATVPFANHPDFSSLTDTRAFDDLINIQEALDRKIVYDEVFMRISTNDSIQYQGLYVLNDSTALIGDKNRRKLMKVTKNGSIKEWLDLPFSPLFIKKHPFTQNFWLATAALPETSSYDPEERGISNVLKINAEEGRILQGFEFRERHLVTHLEIDLNNRLWTSQGATAYLTRNVTDTSRFYGAFSRNYFDLRESHSSIRGMALSDDQKVLYFINGKEGIFRMDTESLAIEKLFVPQDIVLSGMDEIFFYNNTLIVIHNKSLPNRVMQYFLNDTGATILFGNAINQGGDDLQIPVSGYLYEGYFYYIANSVSQIESMVNRRELIIRRMKL